MSELDVDSERVRNAAHYLETNRVRDRQRRLWRLREEGVELLKLIWRQSGAVIENRDGVVTADIVDRTGDINSGAWRRVLC